MKKYEKKTKKNPLTKDDNQKNQVLAIERGENITCIVERFKIISDRYRNRRFKISVSVIMSYARSLFEKAVYL